MKKKWTWLFPDKILFMKKMKGWIWSIGYSFLTLIPDLSFSEIDIWLGGACLTSV